MRKIHRAGFAAVVTAVALLASTATANAASGSAPGSTSAPTPVGTAPVVPFGAHLQGALPLGGQLSFDVVLRPRDQAGLDNFVSAVSTPGSATYRQFLATGEFDTRFGATPATIADVSASLRSLGLTVGAVQGSILPVSGSSSQVGSALHTSFAQYQLASGRIAHANVTAPRLPANIADAVQAIAGLDNLAEFHHPSPKLSNVAGPTAGSAFGTNLAGPTPCSFTLLHGGTPYTADQLASYYGLTSSYTAGNLGAGITVGIVEFEPFNPTDIATYQACYGTSATVTPINVDLGPGTGPSVGEAALDIEDVIGLAPQATVKVYQGPNIATGITFGNVLNVYSTIARDNTQVVSTSWGACEDPTLLPAFVQAERTLFQQMAAQGQSVFAASGDAGSADCAGSTALAVDDPASQPEVTGVGGTNLTMPTESAWNSTFPLGAGGGGRSTLWQMPSWQQPLGVIGDSSGAPCGAPGGTFCREVPDVSASADPNNGYPIFFSDPVFGPGWYSFGGTSAAAPTWAAMIALVDSSCGGNRLGLINPALYQLKAANPAAFHDITSGNNGAFAAIVGYDLATGLGSPVGGPLSDGLCPAPATNGVGKLTVDRAIVRPASLNTFTFTYTAPAGKRLANGKINLVVDTAAGWSLPSTTSGTVGYTTASAGTVAVVGSTIQLTGVSTAANSTVTITYGDTTGGGSGALAPAAPQISPFTATQASTGAGTLTALTPSPQVSVGVAPDGSGTMAVLPSSVPVATPTKLIFTYTPPANTGITNGTVQVTVPAGWTPPQSSTSSAAGYVIASAGVITVTGQVISIAPVSVAIDGMLTITYGDQSSGPGATSPATNETSQFLTLQRSTSSLVLLASSPKVKVGTGGVITITPGGGAPPAPLALIRVSGADRVATSVAASQIEFPDSGTADAVVVARADSFADALSGTPLAVANNAPLLLTGGAGLNSATGAEIQRVLPAGLTVYLLGGNAALSPSIGTALAGLGYAVVRLAGADRYATAVAVADAVGIAGSVFEADGTNFPDALSAGTAAAENGAVILLTAGSHQAAATSAFLTANPGLTRYAIGGPAAAADPGATPYVGADRYATAVLVAQAFFDQPDSVGLASGVSFPDALSGGSVVAMNNGPILLVPSSGALPSAVRAYLATASTTATFAWLFGGTSSVGADVFTAASAALTP